MFPLVYDELRRMAARKLRGERADHTLCTTALVHEAWLELSKLNRIQWQNRIALPGHRGTGDAPHPHRLRGRAPPAEARRRSDGRVRWTRATRSRSRRSEATTCSRSTKRSQRLTAMNERQARIVECRFFGGMSVEETAEALDVSPATVKREWATRPRLAESGAQA